MSFLVQAVGYLNTDSTASVQIEHQPTATARSKSEELEKRKKLIGSKCQIFFKDDPFMVSRASMQYLYDETGKKYLDCISNVQHVVEAISKQLATSTCNVRFVSPQLNDCAEQILATLPPELDTILFCNSGSEANDLALRLARDFSKHTDAIVLDHAYHGHITTMMELSPYKFDHGSSVTKPNWVHVAQCPDVYRGSIKLSDVDLKDKEKLKEAGRKYAENVQDILAKVKAENRGVAAYIAEALQSCGGQVIPPAGYFKDVKRYVNEHGGLVIIDEVQTGFGRVGQRFWAHAIYNDGFVPDILTMGKPMGNGFPVSAVVTRKEIADVLGAAKLQYGGNPVACAAALGVLSVIKDENLLEHRGVGQFWGLDLVKCRETREPDTQLALALILKLRQDNAVLLSADGPHENIIKFKPPLCFNKENLQQAVSAIDAALTALGH